MNLRGGSLQERDILQLSREPEKKERMILLLSVMGNPIADVLVQALARPIRPRFAPPTARIFFHTLVSLFLCIFASCVFASSQLSFHPYQPLFHSSHSSPIIVLFHHSSVPPSLHPHPSTRCSSLLQLRQTSCHLSNPSTFPPSTTLTLSGV